MYGETYYQLPKVFFTNKNYINLSNDAKIAYSLLKDRFNYSIKNNWVDNEKHIYFIYSNKELMSILNCSEKKVISIKKELSNTKLLVQKRVGLNQPNRLYLGKPKANAQDVFLQENIAEPIDTSETVKMSVPDKYTQSLDTNGTVKMSVPDKYAQSLDTSGTVKMSAYLYKDKDLDTLDTLDTKKEALQQQLLLDQFSEVQENTFLSKDSLKFIAAFSNTIQEAHEQVGTIIRAKTKVEKEYNLVLIGEDYQEEIDKCLRRVMHKIKTDSTVKSPKGLFYKSFYNLFVECAIEKKSQLNKKSNSNTSGVITHNWVENQ
ncbi:replication initiator protein A [Enterococcus faecalis]|nr:replication initiator protein A [Enterococcus faecalis]